MWHCWRNLVAIVVICVTLLATTTRAIICYRCTIRPAQYIGEKDQQCSKFDASSRYYVDCPKSTFCRKQIIHYRLPNGSNATTAERDCAPQRHTFQDYNYKEQRWYAKETVDTEIYTEGCFKDADKGTPNGPAEYCYCSSNYCNAATTTATSKTFVGIVGILVVVALIHCSS